MKKNEKLLIFYLIICLFLRGGWDEYALTPLLAITGIFSLVYWGDILLRKQEVRTSSLELIFYLFLSGIILSTFFSKDISKSFPELLKYFVYFLVLAMFLNSQNEKIIKNIIIILTIFGVLFSLLAVYQQFILFPALRYQAVITLRAFANFVHPNSLAVFLLLVIILNTNFLLKSNLKNILLFSLLYLLLILGFLLTFSFVNFLLFFFIFILILYKSKFNKKILWMLFFCVAISSVIIGFSNKYFAENNLSEVLKFSSKRYSFISRLAYWKSCIYQAKNNIMLGSGLGTFSVFLPATSNTGYYSIYPHNIYLQLLCETGILGLFFWLWIAVFLILKSKILIKNSHDPALLCARTLNSQLLIFIWLIIFLLEAIQDINFNVVLLGIIFFMLSGLVIPGKIINGRAKIFYVGLNIFLGIFILISGLRMYFSNQYFNLALKDLAVGEKTRAIEKLKLSLKYYSFNKNAIYKLTETYNLDRNFEIKIAEEFLKQEIKVFPYDYKLYLYLAQNYHMQKNYYQTEQNIKTALRLNPWDIYSLFYLANLYVITGYLNKAEKTIKVIIKNPYFKGGYVDNEKVSGYYNLIRNSLLQKCFNNYSKQCINLIVYSLKKSYYFYPDEEIKKELKYWEKKVK